MWNFRRKCNVCKYEYVVVKTKVKFYSTLAGSFKLLQDIRLQQYDNNGTCKTTKTINQVSSIEKKHVDKQLSSAIYKNGLKKSNPTM